MSRGNCSGKRLSRVAGSRRVSRATPDALGELQNCRDRVPGRHVDPSEGVLRDARRARRRPKAATTRSPARHVSTRRRASRATPDTLRGAPSDSSCRESRLSRLDPGRLPTYALQEHRPDTYRRETSRRVASRACRDQTGAHSRHAQVGESLASPPTRIDAQGLPVSRVETSRD